MVNNTSQMRKKIKNYVRSANAVLTMTINKDILLKILNHVMVFSPAKRITVHSNTTLIGCAPTS